MSAEIADAIAAAYAVELELMENALAQAFVRGIDRHSAARQYLDGFVSAKLGHARRLAQRLADLGANVPGSLRLPRSQKDLQGPVEIESFLSGLFNATADLLRQYQRIVRLCEGFDIVTQDLIIHLLAEEKKHQFEIDRLRSSAELGAS